MAGMIGGIAVAALIFGGGILGITTRFWYFRFLLWLNAILWLVLAVIVLTQGGFVEPFEASGIVISCVILCWPLLGCCIGEVVTRKREH